MSREQQSNSTEEQTQQKADQQKATQAAPAQRAAYADSARPEDEDLAQLKQKADRSNAVTNLQALQRKANESGRVHQLKSTAAALNEATIKDDAPVQRKLDEEIIEQIKQTIGLEAVQIIQLPKGGPKISHKFSTYPDTSRYNLPDSYLNKSLLDVAYPGIEMDAEAMNYFNTTAAYDMVKEMQGGGAFIATFSLAVICEGEGGRALQHEMGHAQQQEQLGAQFTGGEGTTVNQVILEYHNVLKNENKYNNFETIRTYYNSSNLGKHKDKNWNNLMETATEEYPLNVTLLKEIKGIMDQFPEHSEKIERNLISEYFVNVTKNKK